MSDLLVTEALRTHADEFHEGFAAWLSENWHVWRSFEREANRMRRLGRTHYSARTIVHYLRHETAVRQSGGDLKINDHVSPDLGRLYSLVYPEARDFFEFRAIKSRSTSMSARA